MTKRIHFAFGVILGIGILPPDKHSAERGLLRKAPDRLRGPGQYGPHDGPIE